MVSVTDTKTKLILDIEKDFNEEINEVLKTKGNRSKASLVRELLQEYIANEKRARSKI